MLSWSAYNLFGDFHSFSNSKYKLSSGLEKPLKLCFGFYNSILRVYLVLICNTLENRVSETRFYSICIRFIKNTLKTIS